MIVFLADGLEMQLKARYTETDIDGKPFSIPMRSCAQFTTQMTKSSLR
jgi:hypothetical protein